MVIILYNLKWSQLKYVQSVDSTMVTRKNNWRSINSQKIIFLFRRRRCIIFTCLGITGRNYTIWKISNASVFVMKTNFKNPFSVRLRVMCKQQKFTFFMSGWLKIILDRSEMDKKWTIWNKKFWKSKMSTDFIGPSCTEFLEFMGKYTESDSLKI
jgi:hypothetical protein